MSRVKIFLLVIILVITAVMGAGVGLYLAIGDCKWKFKDMWLLYLGIAVLACLLYVFNNIE